MGSGCTKTEAGDVQQSRGADAVDGEQANGTHSADSKKGTYITTIYSFRSSYNCRKTLFVSKLSSPGRKTKKFLKLFCKCWKFKMRN